MTLIIFLSPFLTLRRQNGPGLLCLAILWFKVSKQRFHPSVFTILNRGMILGCCWLLGETNGFELLSLAFEPVLLAFGQQGMVDNGLRKAKRGWFYIFWFKVESCQKGYKQARPSHWCTRARAVRWKRHEPQQGFAVLTKLQSKFIIDKKRSPWKGHSATLRR